MQFLQKLIDSLSSLDQLVLATTGGGSYKHAQVLSETLKVHIEKEDEMDCLIRGLNFLALNVPMEVFQFTDHSNLQSASLFQDKKKEDDLFPYLLVNIGSGVSIIKVTAMNKYERISGTSLGGGTLCGLLSILTEAKDFDQMLELSRKGDNKKVDMLVGDIYGTDYSKIGLKSSTIASSLGKVFKMNQDRTEARDFNQADIATSLLFMVSNNIGQIAYLNAKIHDVKDIYFGGFFIRGHEITMHTISYAIKFWSRGEMTALFLKHEGYLGSLGAIFKE